MAFILQIIPSFSAESFITADPFLQSSEPGLVGGCIWWRGSRSAPVAAPADTARVLHPQREGAASCPLLPPSRPVWCDSSLPSVLAGGSPQRAGLRGRGCAAGLPGSGLVRLFIVGTAAHGGHHSPRWAHDSSASRSPCCLAGRGRAPLQAGLYLRTSCSFGCDCRIPELLITSSSLALPFNPRNISKN